MIYFRTSNIVLSVFLLFEPCLLFGQSQPCVIRNKAMRAGEELTYKVYYTLAGAYVGDGEAIFTSSIYTKDNRYYHLKGVAEPMIVMIGFIKCAIYMRASSTAKP